MQLYTENGYLLSEVISALQKLIRRGEEEEAMYFALELIPKFEKYLWRRLNVIAHEDIGIANVQVLILVQMNEQNFFRFREEGKSGPARLILANTILAMSRSEKSRIADHFQCHVLQSKLHHEPRPIPDVALDKHTSRGKKMGRGLDHWIKEGCKLEPKSKLKNPYEDSANGWWADPKFIRVDWPKPTAPGKKGKGQADMFVHSDENAPEEEDAE